MKRLMPIILCIAIVLAVSGCRGGARRAKPAVSLPEEVEGAIHIKYAQGFSVRYIDGGCLVDITDPQREGKELFRYMLVERGTKPKTVPEGYSSPTSSVWMSWTGCAVSPAPAIFSIRM